MKAARGIYRAKFHKALESRPGPTPRLDPCPVSHPTPGTAPRSPAASEHLMLRLRDWKGSLRERLGRLSGGGWVGEWVGGVGGRGPRGKRRLSFRSSPAAAQRRQRRWDGRGWRDGGTGVGWRKRGREGLGGREGRWGWRGPATAEQHLRRRWDGMGCWDGGTVRWGGDSGGGGGGSDSSEGGRDSRAAAAEAG